MKILLIGEYSNVHATLAEGLKAIGHEVLVISNGDFWKNYPRDIDVARHPGKIGGVMLMAKIYALLPKLRGFDIVQLINPMFLELKAERLFFIYRYLRRHNKRVILGGFGMDWYWVNTCCTAMPLRYSDFNIGKELRTNKDALKELKDWLGTAKERLNKYIAKDCDAIITGLYEYWVCYQPAFPQKTTFIPYPIKMSASPSISDSADRPFRLFIGISKNRSEYKGTDIMLKAAKAIKEKYPDKIELRIAEGVPYAEYERMMDGSDAILDQLYSYTPSMNPLLAMSKGIICIGGGEPENYEIIHETELRPIVNVLPNYESIYFAIENLLFCPSKVPVLKRESIEYILKHHEYIKVARQYEQFYEKVLNKDKE
ncbi:MAG: glycosyltransferase family 1 protein [Prevotella sp.]|nr:glycosyltransferase family 1 protein [Prevotella sp.]